MLMNYRKNAWGWVDALDDAEPPWTRGAASARLMRLRSALPHAIPSDPTFVESNSNDVWLLGDGDRVDRVLRVCWRGDRERFVREARLVDALPASIPHPALIDYGRFDDLTWTLHERVAGVPLSTIWLELPQTELRDLVARFSEIVAALHGWTPPEEIDALLAAHEHEPPHNIEGIVDAALIPLPLPRLLTLAEVAGTIDYVDPTMIAAATEHIQELASADPFPVPGSLAHVVHGDLAFVNILVDGGQITGVLDFEWARKGPRDLELISLVRMVELTRTWIGREPPPVLRWLQEDYPQMFAALDLERRLWLYALAYTMRGIIFWPPDRPEAELEPEHQLHLLRRLTQAPMAW
jgi:aminoglycoside phosphotransferase (APT) family kinase protein